MSFFTSSMDCITREQKRISDSSTKPKKANVDLATDTGAPSLLTASNDGHTEIVQTLLDNKANVDLGNKDGVTPLLIASQNGHTEVVQTLLDNKANVDLCAKNGFTPLDIASRHGRTEVVQTLLNNKANVGLGNKHGLTPLVIASGNDHAQVVQTLLNNKANVDLGTKDGVTPLLLASGNGYTEVVQTLLSNKANVDLGDKDGLTPLLIASKNGHAQVVQTLLDNKANVDLAEEHGFTPLWFASFGGNAETVKILLDHKANLNLAEEHGHTPLWCASQKDHTEIVQMLTNFAEDSHSINSARHIEYDSKDKPSSVVDSTDTEHLESNDSFETGDVLDVAETILAKTNYAFSNMPDWNDTVGDGFGEFLTTVGDVAGDLSGTAKAVVTVIKSIYSMIKDYREREEWLESFNYELSIIKRDLEDGRRVFDHHEFITKIKVIVDESEETVTKITKRGTVGKLILASSDRNDLMTYTNRLNELRQQALFSMMIEVKRDTSKTQQFQQFLTQILQNNNKTVLANRDAMWHLFGRLNETNITRQAELNDANESRFLRLYEKMSRLEEKNVPQLYAQIISLQPSSDKNQPAEVSSRRNNDSITYSPSPSSYLAYIHFQRINYTDLKDQQFIASGNFGDVYRCKWLSEYVAVKKVREQSTKEETKQSFLAEVSILQSLGRYPRIMDTIGICADGRNPYCIVSACQQCSLEDLFMKPDCWQGPPLSASLIFQILADIASGLWYLHKNRIIHRDVATRNALIDSHGRGSLSDFGMSKRLPEGQSQDVVESVYGPVRWMSPEMFKGIFSFDTDVWMFGALLVEVVNCAPPYHNEGSNDEVRALIQQGIEPQLIPSTPTPLRDLIGECFETLGVRIRSKTLQRSLERLLQQCRSDPAPFNALMILNSSVSHNVKPNEPVYNMLTNIERKTSPNSSLSSMLSELGLERFEEALNDFGVEDIHDLEYMDNDAFSQAGMKPLHIRKLRNYLSSP